MKLTFAILVSLILVVSSTEMYHKQFSGFARFNCKLMWQVAKDNFGKSVIISGISVLSQLGQLSLVTVGAARDELLTAIGIDDGEMLRSVFDSTTKQLKAVYGVEISMVNVLFVSSDYRFSKQFMVDSEELFNADIKNINMHQPKEAAKEINDLIEEQTAHRIQDFLHSNILNNFPQAILVNAIHFKGKWKMKFDLSLTVNTTFHISNTKAVQMPMMHKLGLLKYAKSDLLDIQIVEIPYERDEISLLIILPNEVEGLFALEENINEHPGQLLNTIREMHFSNVDLFLPKFKIDSAFNSKGALKKINITKIFESGSVKLRNSLDSNKSDVHISEAIQRAIFEVDEDGSEVEATEDVMLKTFPTNFVADHPFAFAVRTNYNLVLFQGVYCPMI